MKPRIGRVDKHLEGLLFRFLNETLQLKKENMNFKRRMKLYKASVLRDEVKSVGEGGGVDKHLESY